MGDWSRQEIEDAFAHQQQVVREIGQSWDWSRYADLFVEDATYNEHMYGKMAGRERIREWIVSTMNAFPGTEMPFYPVSWYSIDTDKGWVITEIMNRMRDPGDGTVIERPCITILKYPLRGRRGVRQEHGVAARVTRQPKTKSPGSGTRVHVQ
jgi:hypothetical protein